MPDITPILIVLGILTLPGTLVWLFGQVVARARVTWQTCGRIGITALFVLAGIGHFVVPEKFIMILPAWAPAAALVYFTGACEIAGGVGVWLPRGVRRVAAWSLVAFLVCITPANVYAAINRVDVGGHGSGPVYLWARLPLQAFIMWWVWWFGARPGR